MFDYFLPVFFGVILGAFVGRVILPAWVQYRRLKRFRGQEAETELLLAEDILVLLNSWRHRADDKTRMALSALASVGTLVSVRDRIGLSVISGMAHGLVGRHFSSRVESQKVPVPVVVEDPGDDVIH